MHSSFSAELRWKLLIFNSLSQAQEVHLDLHNEYESAMNIKDPDDSRLKHKTNRASTASRGREKSVFKDSITLMLFEVERGTRQQRAKQQWESRGKIERRKTFFSHSFHFLKPAITKAKIILKKRSGKKRRKKWASRSSSSREVNFGLIYLIAAWKKKLEIGSFISHCSAEWLWKAFIKLKHRRLSSHFFIHQLAPQLPNCARASLVALRLLLVSTTSIASQKSLSSEKHFRFS